MLRNRVVKTAGKWLALALAGTLVAQHPGPPAALLSRQEVIQLDTRIVQLVEATMVSTPELSRAGAPLLEDARQALANLHRSPMGLDASNRFLTSMRAYLALADAVPKPYPFPKTAQDQFTELRDSVVRLESHFAALMDNTDHALNGPDPDNLARYGDTNSRLPPVNPNKPRIVFMGDSITDNWRLNEYFPDHDFVNRGISGQTTGQMLGRFEADVVNLHPAAVLIFGGTNDIGRGMPVSAARNNIRMMAELAQFNGIKVLIATLLPVSDYHKNADPNFERSSLRPPEQIRELNRWIQGFCGEKDYTFVNYYSEVVDAAGFLKPDLSDDGLHPNSKGYRIMAPVALKAIESTRAPDVAATEVAAPPSILQRRVMRFARLLLTTLVISVFASGTATLMTVSQLTDFIRSSITELKYPDRQVAQYLHAVKLTEHLDGDRLEALEAMGAGPKTREALEALSTASKSLPAPPPVVEQPKPAPPPVKPPPDSIEQKRIIKAAQDYALTYTKQLPNFICLQVTRRYYDPSGGENWSPLDRITSKLTYFEQKEDYQLVNVAGTDKAVSYWSLGGTLSAGEFGSQLKDIFDPASEATFEWEKWGKLRSHLCYVYSYYIDQSHSRYHVVYEKTDDIIPAYRGLVYIDADTEMVLRSTLEPILPAGYGVKQASIVLDYDYTSIGDNQYLLPLKVMVLSRIGRITTKNDVEFRLYHKYGTEAIVRFDTTDPPPPLPDDATKDAQPRK